MDEARTVVVRDPAELTLLSTRRKFLRALGLGGTIVLMPALFSACDADNNVTATLSRDPQTLDLRTDVGIFNYAYVLEQLEANFYNQVVALPNFATLFPNVAEREVLTDLRNDELVHREFLRAALGTAGIPDLATNFAQIPSTRADILATALTFENVGVAAYNGAGKYIRGVNNLTAAGKIVSVEARHAAALADILDTAGTAFADLGANGLPALGSDRATARDAVQEPSAVLPLGQPFITNTLSIGTGPTAPAS